MPHAALWVVQHYLVFDIATQVGFNAARGFVGGAAGSAPRWYNHGCSFNAARGFVGGAAKRRCCHGAAADSFNAARGFVGGAAFICSKYVCSSRVSMPHAALWVVQRSRFLSVLKEEQSFNAARGFVGGAA